MATEELTEIEGQISDVFRALSNGFTKLEKIKESNRRNRQLEELTGTMCECKRSAGTCTQLIKEFDGELKESSYKIDHETTKLLHERRQSMIRELNSYVALKKQHASSHENKNVDFSEGPHGGADADDNALLTSNMTKQQLIDHGNHLMDEADQAIDRAKKVVHETIDVGTETAATLKSQTEQMSRIVNELDSIHFSVKKGSQLVRELGRQVATDRCIRALLFLIVLGVIAIIIVEIVNPNNKDIRDIPGLAPPVPARRLLRSFD